MKMPRRSTIIFLFALAGCATFSPRVDENDTEALLHAREYFALRDRIAEMPDTPERLLAVAAVLNAFNDPQASNAAVDDLLGEAELPEDLRLHVLRLRRDNYLRLQQYDEAHQASQRLLDLPARTVRQRRADENMAVFLAALQDVPSQSVEIRGDSHLTPDAEGHVPIRVNGHARQYAIDTGANFSVLMRSEAVALGLEIRLTGVEVGTATDVRMLADVAVADSVTLGNVHLKNVVFLVFADRALTFPSRQIRGLIGFPIVEAMREVHFLSDGSMRIPAEPTLPRVENLALDGLDPLIEVRWRDSSLLCRLDTGANTTVFYEPFYQRHRLIVERWGRPHRSRTGGVGGVREFEAFLMPNAELTIGTKAVRISDVDVYTRPLVGPESNYLDCNIGRDVLDQFTEYALNFDSMSLVLR